MEYENLSSDNKGFTLVEIAIVVTIVSILAIAIVGFFTAQRQTYIWEEQKLERDQNVGMALDLITRELQLAGFCAADASFVRFLPLWLPARFIPSVPLDVKFDANPKITLGDGEQPDMLTFACVLPTDLNPTTLRVTANDTTLVPNLSKSDIKKQYRCGDVIQVGYPPTFAIVKGISDTKITIDTDPSVPGNQGVEISYPEGTFMGEVYVVSYAVFNETNDSEYARHAPKRPELKRKVNAGGFQPVTDNISNMKITAGSDGCVQVTLTAKTARVNHRYSDPNGKTLITRDIFIRNTRDAGMATTCLVPAAPVNLNVFGGLDEDYPCGIFMSWDEVSENEDGGDLESIGCPVTGYRIYYDCVENTFGYYMDVDAEDRVGYLLDVGSIPASSFYVSVAARNSGGIGGITGEKKVTDITAPDTPINFRAKITALDQITLLWDSSTACDLAGYFIYRKDASGLSHILNSHLIEKGVEMYVDEGLPPGKTYTYSMEATDISCNYSERSNRVSIALP